MWLQGRVSLKSKSCCLPGSFAAYEICTISSTFPSFQNRQFMKQQYRYFILTEILLLYLKYLLRYIINIASITLYLFFPYADEPGETFDSISHVCYAWFCFCAPESKKLFSIHPINSSTLFPFPEKWRIPFVSLSYRFRIAFVSLSVRFRFAFSLW